MSHGYANSAPWADLSRAALACERRGDQRGQFVADMAVIYWQFRELDLWQRYSRLWLKMLAEGLRLIR